MRKCDAALGAEIVFDLSQPIQNAVFAELDAHCVRPEFCYRHRWQVGDLAMWDNASAMHLAICDCALPERRLMHRTTVIDSPPF